MKINKNILCFILVIFIVGVYGVSCKQDDATKKEGESSIIESKNIQVDAEAALQKRIEDTGHLQSHRKEIIDGMLDGGLASRIENPSGEPYIYVTQPFYLLSKGEQASLLNVVWYYYITQDRSLDVLTVYDNDTGNEVGTFGRKGLLMGE